ncbi:DUF3175 domain-containing protein [Rhodanobacter aciditrophus]|uniref:DUF3175 domain-containing protein n=1 Tax=Rhodanobacter aciditrophus TaxID=1623218 RepID=UPI003CF4F665
MRLYVVTAGTPCAPPAAVQLACLFAEGWQAAPEPFLSIAASLVDGIAGWAWRLPCHLPWRGIPAVRRDVAHAAAAAATVSPRKPRQPENESGRWSQRVTRESHALKLAAGVFTLDDPHRIAASLKASADASRQRRATPFRSAMSMLCFYINRAGDALPEERRACLEAAKDELRALYGRPRRGV